MFEHLQIYDARERFVVGAADVLLAAATAPRRLLGTGHPPVQPRRILLFRLERIGDLLMSLPGIAATRRFAPDARIHLVVGGWNEPIAHVIRDIDEVEVIDASWLARGAPAMSAFELARRARGWRQAGYDLAINFEGDIRSNLLMWLSGARRRIGFDMAGGGPLLSDRVNYDPTRHVADNILRLVGRAFGASEPARSGEGERLQLPSDTRARAAALLDPLLSRIAESRSAPRPLVAAVNVGGGREVKQWEPARFGEVVARMATRWPAGFVLTGADGDRDVIDQARRHVPPDVPVLDLAGRVDLLTLAAVLARVDLLVTGDTGPMHLAAAVGTPIVAIFGPSDARRWGPRGSNAIVVQGDLSCQPCNRIRRPPAHCVGRVPDCLVAVTVDQVLAAVNQVLSHSVAPGGRDVAR